MGTFVKAAAEADIADGSMKHVIVTGKNILVSRIGDDFFAIDDTCTHEQCSLGDEGFLDGNILTCGCHGAQYDVTTGKVLALPAPRDLATYRVKVEGGNVLVEV